MVCLGLLRIGAKSVGPEGPPTKAFPQ
ncbi:DUF6053 domain-containing protein [Lysobacter sp. TAB13]